MPVVLSVSDNANNTGGIGTVSGVGTTDTTTVYYSPWNGEMKAYSWTSGGFRTGNGNVPLALQSQHYQFMAISVTAGGATSFSPLVYQNFSDGSLPIHSRILDGLKIRHDSIGLAWLPQSKVLKRWVPKIWEVVSPPAVAICPVGAEDYIDAEEVIGQDDPRYPSVIALILKTNADGTSMINEGLDWRVKVSKAIRNQRLPGVPEVMLNYIKPLDIVHPEAFKMGYLVSVIMFQSRVRERRGLGV